MHTILVSKYRNWYNQGIKSELFYQIDIPSIIEMHIKNSLLLYYQVSKYMYAWYQSDDQSLNSFSSTTCNLVLILFDNYGTLQF